MGRVLKGVYNAARKLSTNQQLMLAVVARLPRHASSSARFSIPKYPPALARAQIKPTVWQDSKNKKRLPRTQRIPKIKWRKMVAGRKGARKARQQRLGQREQRQRAPQIARSAFRAHNQRKKRS